MLTCTFAAHYVKDTNTSGGCKAQSSSAQCGLNSFPIVGSFYGYTRLYLHKPNKSKGVARVE